MYKIEFKSLSGIVSHWLFKYTVLFIICSLLVFWQIVYYGKSFINVHDGYMQVFTFLVYWGKYLRNFCVNIFIHHDFYIPDFDLSLGLGGNIVEAFAYYGLGDVLNLFFIFFSPEKTEILYTVLVFVRLYLAGIFFFIFCRHHWSRSSDYNPKTSNTIILIGGGIYVFSYWTIETATMHTYFLNPLVYFPLVLLGIDYILEKKRPYLFIVACTLALYASVYFFYMMTILAGIYIIVLLLVYRKTIIRFRNCVQCLLLIFFSYLITLIIASPIFIPFVRTVLSGGRIGAQIPLLYELLYYIKLPVAFINASADHYCSMGYSTLAFAAVVLLFIRTKLTDKLVLKIFFLIGLLIILFPFGGHVMNGFGYPTNRWIWGFNLLVSMIFVYESPAILSLEKKFIVLLGILTFVFALPNFAFRSNGMTSYKMMAVVLTFTFIVFIIYTTFSKRIYIYLFAILFINIFLSAYSHYSPFFFNWIKQIEEKNIAYTCIMNSQFKLFDDYGIDEKRTYRIDTASATVESVADYKKIGVNSSIIVNRFSTALYYSTNDSSVRQLLKNLGIPASTDLFYVGLNERAFPEAFLGCKYCVVNNNESKYLPYGYTAKLTSNENKTVYENTNVLPLAFAYNTFISKTDYDVLPSYKKQQAIIQTAALDFDSKTIHRISPAELVYTDKNLSYTIKNVSDGIVFDANNIVVTKKNAFVEFECESCGSGEYYIVFDDLNYENGIWKRVNSSTLKVSYGDVIKYFQIRNKTDYMYSNIHDFIYNIGYIENPLAKMTICLSFDGPGTYSFDKLTLICQPVDKIPEYVTNLTQDYIDYHFKDGRMFIICDMLEDKILCVSAPYQTGSYAIIDGKKQNCFCVNNFATGVSISKGKHCVVVCF